jgi:hypothetical protein
MQRDSPSIHSAILAIAVRSGVNFTESQRFEFRCFLVTGTAA